MKKSKAEQEFDVAYNKKADRKKLLHEEHVKKGNMVCARCGRVSGMKYRHPDGSVKGVSLKRISETTKFICHGGTGCSFGRENRT